MIKWTKITLGILWVCVVAAAATAATTENENNNKYESGIPVEVSLVSSWNNTPMLLEGLEAVAAATPHEPQVFWDTVDALGDVEPLASAEAQHAAFVAAARTAFGRRAGTTPAARDTHVALLQLQLAYRAQSAAVAVHEALGRGVASPDAELALVLDGHTHTTLEAALAALTTPRPAAPTGGSDAREGLVAEVDHFCPACAVRSLANATAHARIAVLYAHAGTGAFVRAHTALVNACRERAIDGYVLRHAWHTRHVLHPNNYVGTTPDVPHTPIPGFGVEFALKSIEYKVIDDQDVKSASDAGSNNNNNNKNSADNNSNEKEVEKEGIFSEEYPFRLGNNFDKLTKRALARLEPQVAKLVATSKDPLETLRVVSQHFPIVAEHISKTVKLVSMPENNEEDQDDDDDDDENNDSDEKTERKIEERKAIAFQNGREGLEVNGLEVDKDKYDMYSLLEIVGKELETVEVLEEAHVSRGSARMLVQAGLQTDDDDETAGTVQMRYRIAGEGITFLNDLETRADGEMYASWPRSLQTYQVGRTQKPRYVARNLVTGVLCVDPLDRTNDDLVNDVLFYVIRHMFPLRVGLVLRVADVAPQCDWRGVCTFGAGAAARESPSLMLARVFHHVLAQHGWRRAGSFFWYCARTFPEARELVTVDHVRRAMAALYRQGGLRESADLVWRRLLRDTRYDARILAGARYLDALALDDYPQAFLNGAPVAPGPVDAQHILAAAVTTHFDADLARRIAARTLTDATPDIYAELLDPARHPEVLPEFSKLPLASRRHPARFVNFLHHSAALDALRSAQFYHGEDKDKDTPKLITTLVCAKGNSKGSDMERAVKLFTDYARAHKDDVRVAVFDGTHGSSDAQRTFCRELGETLNVDSEDEETAAKTLLVTLNGRAYAVAADSVAAKDVAAIHTALLQDARTVARLVDRSELDTAGVDPDALGNALVSDLRTRLHSYYLWRSSAGSSSSSSSSSASRRGNGERRSFNSGKPTFVVGNEGNASVVVTYRVNPLSMFAQRVTPRLQALVAAGLPVAVRVQYTRDFFDARAQQAATSIPLKTFYTALALAAPVFARDGALAAPRTAMARLPATRLVTLGMDVPYRWLVMARAAAEDLDNIRLDAAARAGRRAVEAVYALENLLVEGACHGLDAEETPPSGLELELVPKVAASGLGTSGRSQTSDTLVMTILGYFQLKAAPGLWDLRIRAGRSDDLFVVRPDGTPYDGSDAAVRAAMASAAVAQRVVLRSMTGAFVPLRVQKRPGLESIKLLDDKQTVPSASEKRRAIAAEAAAKAAAKAAKAAGKETVVVNNMEQLEGMRLEEHVNEDDGKVHIFSVASGHLYERFVKIMVLSVVRRASVPCKFWFIENYLSPRFKETIGVLAAAYGFEYEFVTYKWPVWLHEQTEKQRLIWGYKILFLDVIFPISLGKVIYVDADQVVRTDMKTLMDLDLHRAAVGMTPFCSGDIMNNDTARFRFWDTGFWKDHLRGHPYHISALFVVDLRRFRALGAGDTYRRVYNSLAPDPNSLANLDQDLPNYLQFDVPMYSLDRHWLWCESWCSNTSKPLARTIDLCNNPLTKRPKLDAAKLFIEEWSQLDNNIRETEARALSSSSSSSSNN